MPGYVDAVQSESLGIKNLLSVADVVQSIPGVHPRPDGISNSTAREGLARSDSQSIQPLGPRGDSQSAITLEACRPCMLPAALEAHSRSHQIAGQAALCSSLARSWRQGLRRSDTCRAAASKGPKGVKKGQTARLLQIEPDGSDAWRLASVISCLQQGGVCPYNKTCALLLLI